MRRHVLGGNHRLALDVAEEGDLGLDLMGEEAIGAAQQDVRLDSDREQFLDRVLGGLGLQLAGGGDVGHQRHVHEERVLAAQLLPHLADGFHKGQRLDVADRAADLHDGEVDVLRHLLHRTLDFVGDVRNDLDGLAQIVAAALLGDDGFVDAAGGPVIVAGQLAVGEALVVPEVEVGLGAVIGDEDLAVLERRHGAGVDVQIGIELLQRDLAGRGSPSGSRSRPPPNPCQAKTPHRRSQRCTLLPSIPRFWKFVLLGYARVSVGGDLCAGVSAQSGWSA